MQGRGTDASHEDAAPAARPGEPAAAAAQGGDDGDPLVGRIVVSRADGSRGGAGDLGPWREHRLVARIARGGLSAVYRAEARGGEVAAVKVLDSLYADLTPLRQRFAREAEVAERLDGQGAPALLGEGEIDGRPYLLLELVDGELLSRRIARGRVEAGEAVEIAVAILGALAPAHRIGIVHLDVKPANVMLARGGGVKLFDFSSAPLSDDGVYPGVESEPLGTPAYSSPEQVDGRPVDARADLYAVGVVLFELVAGRRPFRGDPVEVLRAHAERPAPALGEVGCAVSPELGAAVARALAKPAGERFPDAEAMIAALRATPEGARR